MRHVVSAIVAKAAETLRIDERDVYVAGPAAFVAAILARLADAGLPSQRVRVSVV